MATVDSYISINLITGFDFSVLLTGDVTSASSGDFRIEQIDARYDWLFGTGLSVGADTYGRPVVTGTVEGYFLGQVMGGVYQPVMAITDFSAQFADVIGAALTPTLADDALVVRNVLAGNDTILGSDYADVLSGFAGNDYIHGYSGNDFVYGDAGNDIVNGGWDGDQVFGSAGNDTCLGGDDAGNDVVHGDDGNDIVRGGAGIDQCYGDAGIDQVYGEAGNDSLYGGLGLDQLTGGANSDRFVFNTRPAANNYDRILDFYAPQDTIVLENAVMAVGAVGGLKAALFWKSATGLAHDANDRIIYETDTGWLNYDSNGSAAGGAVHLALMGKNLPLTSSDFAVM